MLTNSNFLHTETGKKGKKSNSFSVAPIKHARLLGLASACVRPLTSHIHIGIQRSHSYEPFLHILLDGLDRVIWETILSPETLSFHYLACVTFDFNDKNISAGTRLVYWFASSVAYPITLPTAIWLSDFFTIDRFVRNNTDLWHRQFAKSVSILSVSNLNLSSVMSIFFHC